MKKALLLGDSIRMGYQDFVKEMLRGECEVYFSEDNGRFASYTLWQANQMYKEFGHFDVVHFNTGYWDMNIEAPMKEAMTPIYEYCRTMKRIINLSRDNADALIYATTLPVLEKGSALDVSNTGGYITYDNNWVSSYNNAAKKLMNEENVAINDLYELVHKGENYYKCPDLLHLTVDGYKVCAAQVASCIRQYL